MESTKLPSTYLLTYLLTYLGATVARRAIGVCGIAEPWWLGLRACGKA